MTWSLYSNGKFLEPLKFSNGKTQEDIVKEVLDSIKEGNKIIFVRGMCGTGKSAIALNLAKELGKTSIVVPIKNLQEQYKKDYEEEKYVLKKNGEKLKISVITGRKNHKCKFLDDNKNAIPVVKKEIDENLHDIFEGRRERIENEIAGNLSADNSNIPCKIEIRERNWNRIKEYINQNKNVNIKNFESIKDVKRLSVAPACPYWCPVLPSSYEPGKGFGNTIKRKYTGLNGKEFIFYNRKLGCDFYQQFNHFVDSDVIVFNSLKYKLESILNRKPLTEIEIIDECDEFLDSFSNQKTINFDKLQNSLIYAAGFEEELENVMNELGMIAGHIRKNERVRNSMENNDIIPLKETGVYDLFNVLINNESLLQDVDEESYIIDVLETAMEFKNFFDDSYVAFEKRDENVIASIVTINLEKKLKEMIDKNKILIMMSGTLHSEQVLKDIFGIQNFKIIEAETEQQGEIEIIRNGLERDCKYSNFSRGKLERKEYLIALDKCVEISKKPVIIHVNSFMDLPNKKEIAEFGIKSLMPREELVTSQEQDFNGKSINDFKSGKIDILFSTRVSRGMDFPGEQCNSIIFTKYPNPNVQDAFWKILAKTRPNHYWGFYRDKANREILQKIYRGLRSKEDKIQLLSPDSRVLEFFEKNSKL